MIRLLYATRTASRCFIGLLLTLCLSLTTQAQIIHYVKPDDGRTPKDGLSWVTAYDQSQLQQAVYDADAASGIDKQVWVAAGTYKPGTNRYTSFYMRDNVTIYGGFTATGSPTMTSRNPDSFTTILSGEIGDPASTADNAYAVVLNSDFALYGPNSKAVGPTAILDGFTITGGQARGGYDYIGTYGGGHEQLWVQSDRSELSLYGQRRLRNRR